MNIQCISQRPTHVDTIYGTGNWVPDEVKDVPDDLARKMLKHKDVYAEPVQVKAKAPAPAIKTVVIAPPPQDTPLQEVYDSIANMNVEQMKSFVESKFNMKVDMRKYATEASMRAYTLMLVEQYGVA